MSIFVIRDKILKPKGEMVTSSLWQDGGSRGAEAVQPRTFLSAVGPRTREPCVVRAGRAAHRCGRRELL